MWSAERDTASRRTAEWLGSFVALVTGLVLATVFAVTRAWAPAAAGVGDRYFPDAGGSGYDVVSYAVDVSYDPATGVLEGSTWVTLLTSQPLDVVHLDLLLGVTAVTVGGVPADYRQQGADLAVSFPTLVGLPANRAGSEVSLEVTYRGNPSTLRFPDLSPVYIGQDELLICGEPESASAWFPSNDHPSDPATYDISVSVPTGVEAISVGRLVEHGADPNHPGRDTWHWRTDSPSPTYTTMLAVGQYDVEVVPVVLDGVARQAVYAVSELQPQPQAALDWLATSAEAVDALERHLGPYPLTSLGGVVPGVRPWWGGMETVGRPVYHPQVVGHADVIDHELAHQWLGDTVTLERWQDIFLNEALASYAEWLVTGETGGPTPQQRFDEQYATAPDDFWRLRLSDPGSAEMFTRVYDRGPMVVHALRVRMGDEAFARFFRDWADGSGPKTLDDWRRAAEAASPVDVVPLLSVWLDGTSKVPATAENGFR